jgi:hypothetical protein
VPGWFHGQEIFTSDSHTLLPVLFTEREKHEAVLFVIDDFLKQFSHEVHQCGVPFKFENTVLYPDGEFFHDFGYPAKALGVADVINTKIT